MDRPTIVIDSSTTRLRRVGRLARRRMRIDGASVVNGLHTDGTLTVEISGLGSPVAGVPDSFEWQADRPIALVIVRSGVDGDDVTFQLGPSRSGSGRGAMVGDGTGIRSIAFCYDAAPGEVSLAAPTAPEARGLPVGAATTDDEAPIRRRIAAAASAPTRRERRSILARLLAGSPLRGATV